jgi:3D (Asp-Asp-Asp) domain-containing protein
MRSILACAFAVALLAGSAPSLAQTNSQTFVTVQPVGQWLASQFNGQPVTNDTGESIGNISDLLFDKSGRIANVVIGVGGFLGIGEKNVAMPFTALSVTADANGKRVVKVALSKDQLKAAPDFKATEKTVYMRAREQASEWGEKAVEKAGELKDKAGKKMDQMRSSEPRSEAPKNN